MRCPSPEHISPAIAISPFLCTDSSEALILLNGPPSQDLLCLIPLLPWRIRLASRHASPRSSDHHSSSSSSSSDSSGLDASDQAHSGSSTRDVSPRLCYPLRRVPRNSKAFCRWCAAPLSTLYPPTTSESSLGDSSERPLHSSSHSAGPSHKRCRSPVDFVPSSTLVIGSLAPTHADLLPPRKRDIRDDTDEYEADTSAGDTVEVGIDPMSAPIVEEEIVEPAREDSSDSSGTRDDIVKLFEDMPIDLDDAVRDFYYHMFEVKVKNLKEEYRPFRRDRDDTLEVLAAHEVTRAANALETENQSQNGSDGDNGNGGNGNVENENPEENGRGDRPALRMHIPGLHEVSTTQLLRTEGVVGLISMVRENGISVSYQQLLEKTHALTWWNSHKRTIGTEAAFSMSWRELMKLMTEVYCLRNEIQKMETEL
ncbi:hypothetical protein Tco_0837176 [Tanacetum coccineum]